MTFLLEKQAYFGNSPRRRVPQVTRNQPSRFGFTKITLLDAAEHGNTTSRATARNEGPRRRRRRARARAGLETCNNPHESTRFFALRAMPGPEELGENVPIQPNDSAGLVRFAKENQIGLTVVGPDDPLAAGLVDEFQKENLRIFGPTKSAARLESSKVFAKQLMRSAGVPTAMAGVFDDSRKACRFAEKLHYPVVIKADGLAAGKGVVIAPDVASAIEAITDMIDRRPFRRGGRPDADRGISRRLGMFAPRAGGRRALSSAGHGLRSQEAA